MERNKEIEKKNEMLEIKNDLEFFKEKSILKTPFGEVLFKNGASVVYDDFEVEYLDNIKNYYFYLYLDGYEICSFPNGTKILDCSGQFTIDKKKKSKNKNRTSSMIV